MSATQAVAEGDLAALKERALAAAEEGITISDPRQPDNPIIYANRGFERLTGYQANEVLGRNCRFLQGPETDPSEVARMRRAIAAGRSITTELRNYRRDGSPFWNRLSITPVLAPDGSISHFIGVQSDVTARREAEEKLRLAYRDLERANERMSRSLEAAAQIQRSLLPEQLPEVEGIEFAWTFEPCDELAGDSLNVFRIDERTLGLYVLDVSGHGVPAALLSVTLARVLSFARRPIATPGSGSFADPQLAANPRAVAERLNKLFPMGEQSAQYFTLFYAVLDLPTRELRYVTAGHPAPVLQRPGEPCRHLPVGGFPIGMASEPNYEERRFALAPGDRLFVYTDGLIEAANSSEVEFGAERLEQEIGRAAEQPLAAGVEAVSAAAERWSGGALDDDLSILALEIEASAPRSLSHREPERRRVRGRHEIAI